MSQSTPDTSSYLQLSSQPEYSSVSAESSAEPEYSAAVSELTAEPEYSAAVSELIAEPEYSAAVSELTAEPEYSAAVSELTVEPEYSALSESTAEPSRSSIFSEPEYSVREPLAESSAALSESTASSEPEYNVLADMRSRSNGDAILSDNVFTKSGNTYVVPEATAELDHASAHDNRQSVVRNILSPSSEPESYLNNFITSILVNPESEPVAESSGTMAETEPYAEPTVSEDMVWFVVAFYSLYIALIIVGNLLIVFTVKRNRILHTSSGFFICSLSMAYICVGLFVLPVEITAMFPEAGLPTWACKACHFSALTSATAAIMTLMAASVNRYRAIMYAEAPHLSVPQVVKVASFCWMLAALYGIRMIMYSDMTSNSCVKMMTAPVVASHLCVLFDLFLMFVIPLLLVLSLNLVIISYLKEEILKNPKVKELGDANRKKMMMVVVLTLIFFVTRLPLFVSHAIASFYSNITVGFACMISLKLLSFTSAWTHVIVFFYFNEKAYACLKLMFGGKISPIIAPSVQGVTTVKSRVHDSK